MNIRRDIINSFRGNGDNHVGEFRRAQFDLPEPTSIRDREVKPAETDEDDEEQAVQIKSGTAETGEDAGWYRVEFETPFNADEVPIVVATAEERGVQFNEGQFTPPEHGIVPPEDVDISIDDVDFGVDLGEIDLFEVAVSNVDVVEVALSSIDIGSPQVSSVSLDTVVEQPDISIDLPGDPTIGNRLSIDDFNLSSLSFDDVAIEGVDVDDVVDVELAEDIPTWSDFERFSFEERFVALSRNTGEYAYEIGAEVFDGLPDFASDPFIDAWDDLMIRAFGYGSREKRGTGLVENQYANVGQFLDDEIEGSFTNKRDELMTVGERVKEALEDYNDELITYFEDLIADIQLAFDDIDANVEDELNDEVTGIQNSINDFIADDLQSQLNTKVIDEASTQLDESFDEIEDNLFAIRDGLVDQQEDIIAAIEDSNIEAEDAILDVATSLEDLSSVIEDDLNIVVDDTNEGLDTLASDTQSEMRTLSSDIEEQVNNSVSDLGSDVNESLSDAESQLNQQFTNIEESLNSDISTINDGFDEVDSGVSQLVNNIEDALEQYNDNVLQAYSDVTSLAQEALNYSPKLLYSSLGVPEEAAMSPVQTRNITNESFEILGYEGGMKVDWIAMGRTDSEVSVGDPEDIVDRVIERLEERGDIDIGS